MYQIYIEIKFIFVDFEQILPVIQIQIMNVELFLKKIIRSKNILMSVDHNHQTWGPNYQNSMSI